MGVVKLGVIVCWRVECNFVYQRVLLQNVILLNR